MKRTGFLRDPWDEV